MTKPAIGSRARLFLPLIICVSVSWPQEYTISTIAGGVPPPTPVAATEASIGQASGVATDSAGNTYFTSLHWVFKIDPTTIPPTGPAFRSTPFAGPLRGGTVVHLPPESWSTSGGITGPLRPEYATFYMQLGAALWHIQYLEDALVSFVALKIVKERRHAGHTVTMEDAQGLLADTRKLTLGPLIEVCIKRKIVRHSDQPRFEAFKLQAAPLLRRGLVPLSVEPTTFRRYSDRR